MPQDEAELVAKASQGDAEAFAALYRKYEKPLYRFVLYLTGKSSLAEELYQETWCRVARSFHKNRSVDNFKNWLFTISVNLYRDEIRKKKVQRFFLGREGVQEDYDDELPCASIVVPSVKDSADQFELWEALNVALKSLTFRQKTVFMLHHVEGFRLSEIGKILKISEGTVKATLHKAVLKIRNELDRLDVA